MVICQLLLQMADEIAFENGQISNFEGLVTLTLDWVILHTVVHHSLTSTHMPNFTEIEKRLVDGQTYERTYGRTFDTCFHLKTAIDQSRTDGQTT